MAGLRKGDSVSISRESLPGAVLFPAIKYKEYKEVAEKNVEKKEIMDGVMETIQGGKMEGETEGMWEERVAEVIGEGEKALKEEQGQPSQVYVPLTRTGTPTLIVTPILIRIPTHSN
jgi:hypothetical protein